MRNYVASYGVLQYYTPIDFKKDLLFFDKVLLLKDNLEIAQPLRQMLLLPSSENLEKNIKTIDFLIDKGLYEYLSNETSSEKFTQGVTKGGKDKITELIGSGMLDIFDRQRAHEEELKKSRNRTSLNDSLKWFTASGYINARLWATILNVLENDTYHSSFNDITPIDSNTVSKKELVLKFLYNKIPVVDSQISWEEFLEYKSDKEVQRKYYALINWVNEVANSNLSTAEIQDKFEYLYREYEYQLNLHKKKISTTTFQIVVNSPLEALENLVKLNFSKLLNPFFNISKAKMDLLEAETKITGRELGYIFDINNKLDK